MNVIARLFVLALLGSNLSCSSDDDSDQPCDPYTCDCGVGEQSSGPPPTCVGTPLCNQSSDCPVPRSGSIEPLCQDQGDVIVNGYTGKCVLGCGLTSMCPTGAECLDGACKFRDE